MNLYQKFWEEPKYDERLMWRLQYHNGGTCCIDKWKWWRASCSPILAGGSSVFDFDDGRQPPSPIVVAFVCTFHIPLV